ncbi:MAG: sulfite exporter TauE/SafE family protein [Rhodospirillales bacterium]|nr:sulfite exporter TauE/SafE family protein [Rhodospirillales bacterium]
MPEIAGIGIASAFLAGLVSFLSPCVLPMVPGYVSYVAGRSLDELSGPTFLRTRLAVLGLSASFVLGFSAVFIALGASATALGQLFQSYRFQADLIAGGVVILFGFHMMGAFRFAWLIREWRVSEWTQGGSPLGAFFLGTAFAFGWTPCIGPILGAILAISAITASVSGGIALLSIYSLGLAIPFLLVAAFTGFFMERFRGMGRVGHILQQFSGAILVLVGVTIMTGMMGSFGTWLLRTFPAFQKVVL